MGSVSTSTFHHGGERKGAMIQSSIVFCDFCCEACRVRKNGAAICDACRMALHAALRVLARAGAVLAKW
jgi:hypothetical protein